MVDIVVWQDPPPDGRNRNRVGSRYAEVAAELRRNPGRWALVDGPPHAVTEIKRGVIPAFRPAGDFEAVTRKVDGDTALFVRYVGPAGEAA